MITQIMITIPAIFGIFLGFFGRYISRDSIKYVLIAVYSIMLLVLIYILRKVSHIGSFEIVLFPWLSYYFPNLNFGFNCDMLSISMCIIVNLISMAVLNYATGYMEGDAHIVRFITYLLFFTFFMLVFVTSNNLVQSFIGWEGVGIVSYLLINFWFTRVEANRSAFKAIIFNRFGDLSFIISFIMLLFFVKTANVSHINSFWLLVNESLDRRAEFVSNMELCFSFLFIGAMCKSAQIGFHAWLPDAMEGPTPVSALLHSATMVTAGIFIFLRMAPVLLLFVQLNFVIAVIGSITALVGATVAFFNEDIKKIIAYSTCSQLGILFSAIGVGNYNGCFFHIATHAFFKALLFLTAGSVIHAIADEQDIRKMGGLLKYLPYTAICMLIGVLGLVGFPFLSGFYSKEFIVFFSLVQSSFTGNFVTTLVFLASIFTMLYGLKLFYFIFLTSYRGFKSNLKFISEPTLYMSLSMGLLSFLTIFAGYFLVDFLLYNGNYIWMGVFPPINDLNDTFVSVESLNFFTKSLLFWLFIILGLIFYFKSNFILEWRLFLLKQNTRVQFLVNFFNVFFFQTWMFNYLYTFIVHNFMKFSFDILLFQVNNFIEYSFIVNLKGGVYRFSNLISNSFSNDFFKNISYILVLNLVLVSTMLYLSIVKVVLLGCLCNFLYNNSKKNIICL